ncbi:MAG: DUF502 domain-containing protein [Gemmatimonadetes bacterium]|nr:DUF502 domain-containing protein [Gemmatimonadota bacterium]
MSWRAVFRRRLIAGTVVILPVTATIVVLLWIFRWLDGLLGRFLYPGLSRYIPWIDLLPGLGVVVLVLLLITVGWITERTIGARLVGAWHALLDRIPMIRRIYSAANRITGTVFGKDRRPFKTVVIVEYPSDGRWAIGFLAASEPAGVSEHVPDAVSVFVPSTPNPTTGWLVIVPRSRVRELSLTVDEAFTMILSGGAATPDQLANALAPPEASATPGRRLAPAAARGADT